MANVVVKRSDKFPIGTTVGAYPRNAATQDGPPSGQPVQTAVVASDGSLTFTGLTAEAAYVLYASVNGETRRVSVWNSKYVAPPVSLLARIQQQREAVGA